MSDGQHVFSSGQVRSAIWIAGENWIQWRDCFEFIYEQGCGQHPLLEEARYSLFTSEYGVLRGATARRRIELRSWLLMEDRLHRMITTDDGSGIDNLAAELSLHFKIGFQRSFLSKLAAFYRPAHFVAWDQYARRGVSILLKRPTVRSYGSYAEYLEAVDIVWGQARHAIEAITATMSPATALTS